MRKALGLYWPDAVFEERGNQGGEKHVARYLRSADQTLPRVMHYCRHFRQVVQAGGHCGAWPAWLSQRFDEVHTWEPDGDNYACLQANVPSAHAHQALLGADTESRRLKYNQRNSGGHKGLPEPGQTPTETIDSYGLEPAALILDVEGMELPALQGAQRTIERCGPVILIEDRGHGDRYGWGTPHSWLRDRGYQELEQSAHDRIFVADRHRRRST